MMRHMRFQWIALTLALWIHDGLGKYSESFDRPSPIQQREVLLSRDNGTSPTTFTGSHSNSSESDDKLDGIQASVSTQNSTLNSTYLIIHNNSSATSGGRRLIETDTSNQHGFLTANCDALVLGPAESATLEEMLAQVQANLRIVINQAKKGIASKYGFQALFKSQSNKGQVASIFNKIMTVADANNDPDQAPIPPLIICVSAETNDKGVKGMEVLYQKCKNDPDQRAVQPLDSNVVVLCPSFWEMPGVPPHGTCPKKDAKTGLMVPNEMWLQLNRQATFVHEMVHMYLGHGYALAKNETYKVGDAVALGEEQSMRNPSNYAFFYAAVIAGCRRWPYKSTNKEGDDGGL